MGGERPPRSQTPPHTLSRVVGSKSSKPLLSKPRSAFTPGAQGSHTDTVPMVGAHTPVASGEDLRTSKSRPSGARKLTAKAGPHPASGPTTAVRGRDPGGSTPRFRPNLPSGCGRPPGQLRPRGRLGGSRGQKPLCYSLAWSPQGRPVMGVLPRIAATCRNQRATWKSCGSAGGPESCLKASTSAWDREKPRT